MAIRDIGYTLEYFGIRDIIIPFILVFTIVFAVLQKIQIFGEKSKRFNGVIALALGLGVIIPHMTNSYSPQLDVVNIMNNALPNISLFLVAIIMLLVMIGAVGGKPDESSTFATIMGFISIFALVYIFGTSIGWFQTPYFWDYYISEEMQTLFVILLVFGIIVWFVTGDENKSPGNNMGDFLKKFFKSGGK